MTAIIAHCGGETQLRRIVWLGLLFALFEVSQGLAPGFAMESAAIATSHATASLITDTDVFAPGQAFHLALRLRLAPGWHTYWQNPGDAGIPPSLDLKLPSGVTAGPIVWPAPEVLPEPPLVAYGYTGEVVLPLAITPPAPFIGPLTISATARYLVCATICVPEEAELSLLLPVGAPSKSPQAGLFSTARTPSASVWPAEVAPDGTVSVRGSGAVQAATFFPLKSGLIVPSAPQTLHATADGFSLALQPDTGFDATANLTGVLSVTQGGQTRYVSVSALPGPKPEPGYDLPHLLLLAFAGGLILNGMPCVFPVLAMKALALARMSGGARREMRAHAFSYTAGVVLAFLALALTLLGLRSAGLAAGWGFQFQSPIFVAAMAWLLFGVGLNLSGVFQVGVPMTGAGQNLAARSGHAGSFFTGLLAALVATPCTAPFMGAALAAALAAPAATEIAIFVAMGLGLAAPYILLGMIPGAARLFPRPGRWMEVLRQGLAFPMYSASAWLLWVVNQEAGPSGVLGTASGLVLLGFAAWAGGLSQSASGQGRRLGQSAALAAILAALAILPGIGASSFPSTTDAETFSPSRLAALQAEGRPVFVNLTAAWCVTCLVNERVALSPAAVQQAFADHRVAYLKGDWTRQDPDITAFLHRAGRDGVPLYLLYSPGNPVPTVLPQILTERAVLDEVARSGG
jgi:thiol:disulfide interchange protein DsbD